MKKRRNLGIPTDLQIMYFVYADDDNELVQVTVTVKVLLLLMR